ncbi:MAG TPA: hypothetical protein VI756_22300 [Blastocatellia bacterium]
MFRRHAKTLALVIVVVLVLAFMAWAGEGLGSRRVPGEGLPAAGAFQASTLAGTAFSVADGVFMKAKVVSYKHLQDEAANQVRVIDDKLTAQTDCSGFISYVLGKSAPMHYKAVMEFARRRYVDDQKQKGLVARDGMPFYPDAKDYADFFATLDSNTPKHGWISVDSVWDLQQGDIIAWGKDNWDGKGNSGHVAMVIEPPSTQLVGAAVKEKKPDGTEAEMTVNCVNIHVLDSSADYHFPTENLPPQARPAQKHRDGLGKGYVRLVLDSNGRPVKYWEGFYSGEAQKAINAPSKSTDIHFARLMD